jgi:hypothetical protein
LPYTGDFDSVYTKMEILKKLTLYHFLEIENSGGLYKNSEIEKTIRFLLYQKSKIENSGELYHFF